MKPWEDTLPDRECHNAGCRKGFTPTSPTQYHCSEECAWTCLKRQHSAVLVGGITPLRPEAD
jgi:hypothetical protein